jgi:hypothetical protein
LKCRLAGVYKFLELLEDIAKRSHNISLKRNVAHLAGLVATEHKQA